jgi:DNA-binding transcriptional MerR regulator
LLSKWRVYILPAFMKTIYLVKDLARATGHSVYTVEYYLKVGLLKEFGRGPDTRYRYFDDATVKRLKTIRLWRKEGKSVKDILSRLQKRTHGLLRVPRA